MALKKEIELENGVILNYHRITSLNKITNVMNKIEVNSYVSESQRNKEKRYQELQLKKANGEELTEEEEVELEKGINVIVLADYIDAKYDNEMTVQDAYEYLKTLDKYSGAEDI